jgi:hypothetical protein
MSFILKSTDCYLVKDAYQILSRIKPNVDVYSHIIWNEALSMKLSLFAWRLSNKKIPNKDTLSQCGAFSFDTLFFRV